MVVLPVRFPNARQHAQRGMVVRLCAASEGVSQGLRVPLDKCGGDILLCTVYFGFPFPRSPCLALWLLHYLMI